MARLDELPMESGDSRRAGHKAAEMSIRNYRPQQKQQQRPAINPQAELWKSEFPHGANCLSLPQTR